MKILPVTTGTKRGGSSGGQSREDQLRQGYTKNPQNIEDEAALPQYPADDTEGFVERNNYYERL